MRNNNANGLEYEFRNDILTIVFSTKRDLLCTSNLFKTSKNYANGLCLFCGLLCTSLGLYEYFLRFPDLALG